MRLIEKGEGKTIEFKAILPPGSHIAKTVVAFSNMAGGRLIIGVEDKTGEITGIDDDEAIELPDRISNIIHDRCSPFILPEIYIEPVGEAKVLVVQVFPGSLKPYFLKEKGKRDGIYVRVGATNKPADIDMIMELERQRRNVSFDEEIDFEKDENDLDLERLADDFYKYTKTALLVSGLLNLKILKEAHEKIRPTFGGLLLAGKNDYMEYARFKCARFKGVTMDEFIDQKEFTGPLYRQVEEAMKFARVYIAKSGKVKGLQRMNRYEVPMEVLREALVNAVVHRDYSISGSDIKFAIFDDRIEITSPGALPRSLEIEDIIAGRSEIRNKVIARFFKEIDFIEQWGTGIRKIINLMEECGLRPPQFRESGLFFKITLYKKENATAATITKKGEKTTTKAAKNTITKKTKSTITKNTVKRGITSNGGAFKDKKTTTKKTENTTTKEVEDTITKKAKDTTTKIPGKLLALIDEDPFITLTDMAKQVRVTESGVRYHLKKLKRDGIIKRVGHSKGGYWKIKDI